MTFTDARKLAHQGKPVTRSGWPINFAVCGGQDAQLYRTTYNEHGLLDHDIEEPYTPSPQDKTATDWSPLP